MDGCLRVLGPALFLDAAAASAPVLLRTLALLAEADGDHAGPSSSSSSSAPPSSSSSSAKKRQLGLLAGSQHLFWRRLEQRMGEIEIEIEEQEEEGGEEDGGRGRGRRRSRRRRAPPVVSELSELLRVFRLLASRSLVSPENGVALEGLVFPAALSRRR